MAVATRAGTPARPFFIRSPKGNKMVKVLTNAPKAKRHIEIEYDFGDTLEAMVKKFGHETVFNHALDNMVIGFQANVRGKLEAEGDKRLTDQAIRTAMATWKPGQRKAADPKKKAEAIKATFAKMDPAMKAALLKELRESQKA